MSCDTKQNTLDYLKKKQIITDIRVITAEKLDEFNKANEMLTRVATNKYGLETGGKMLYEIEQSERKYDNNTLQQRTQRTMYATPVDQLFETLDELHAQKTISNVDAIRNILTREPKSRIAYIGTKYPNYQGSHFIESAEFKGALKVKLSNKGFISNTNDQVLFDRMVADYKAETGYEFDINHNSNDAQVHHEKFYKRMSEKGIKGLELIDSKNQMHYVTFPKIKQLEDSYSELDEVSTLNEITGRVEPVSEDVSRSQLDAFNWYYQPELDQIYDTYSPEQVNEMLEENKEGAIETFNKLLYPNEFKNDTFVSHDIVNDQIRNCK
jgi:hypothetical protein